MSTIGNRFFVTALEDGTTIHGSLTSDKPLSQAYMQGSGGATPDWGQSGTSGTNDSPTITLNLLSGSTQVDANQVGNVKDGQGNPMSFWYYNGREIIFSGASTVDTTGTFVKGSDSETGLPNLKIVKNLATSNNKDMDIITFKGTYMPTTTASPIPFSASIQIRITEISANGWLGLIYFVGAANITQAGQMIVMYETLYGGAQAGAVTDPYSVKWYVNDVQITNTTPSNNSTYITTSGTYSPHSELHLYETDVVDHATIRCEFIKDGSTIYNEYVGVDDMQDPEFMYIQYNGENGNAASLRAGEYVKFDIWVGKTNDSNVDEAYNVFKLQLLDGDGNAITTSNLLGRYDSYGVPIDLIPNCDQDSNWRTLLPDEGGKAHVYVQYKTVNDNAKKNLTGLVMASTSV